MIDTDTQTLHMVQLHLDAHRLAGLGQMLGLYDGRQRVSTNYLVHCALGELFQEQAPKPFSVESGPKQIAGEEGRRLRVLGYADVGRAALHELAKGFASPAVYEICDWDRCASKPMPETFPEGMRLQFELRACPVVRKASAGEGQNAQGQTRTWQKGQELDAFLAKAWENPDEDDLSREAVYREWLRRQFEIRGGAEIEPEKDHAGMERFSIERMTRRTHGNGRRVITTKRPDVTLTGTLTVTDGDAFLNLLRSGLGRHKSFGYGMLKVRRA